MRRNFATEWPQLLNSLGALYVRGANVDWAGFERDHAHRRISLPTYPFQRERFWVDGKGAYGEPVNPAPASEDRFRDWLYQPEWRPKPRTNATADYVPAPTQIPVSTE